MVVAVLTYLWGKIISPDTAIEFALGIVICLFAYQVFSANRLMQGLIDGNIENQKSTFGIWREIYYLLQKYAKKFNQEILDAQAQQENFILAIQASPNGILMLDESDHIEWCNHISEGHLRINSKRDALQQITHLVRQPLFIQYINHRQYDEPIQLENMGRDSDLTLSIQLFPYGNNRKLILTQDITQSQKTEIMRRDFIANVSHELRTPLTVLGGFLETVRELKLDEDDRDRYLGLMHVQAERMQSLVADLLILTRLESSPLPPSTQIIATRKLLNSLLDDANALSLGRHQIECQLLSDKDILGDGREILSAFGNLITNAIRYTPDGGKVLIEWKDLPQGAGSQFIVTDTGPGISPEHIPRLTERFYRVDRSRSRDTGGTGLGLAIVKHIANRHSATLKIQSVLGKGSTFLIEFPAWRLRTVPAQEV